MKKRVLIKISGAYLKSNDLTFDMNKINNLANQIKQLSSIYEIGIVVGGGNIFRGNMVTKFDLDRNVGDQIGMLATLMNGLLIQNVFTNLNIKSKIYSALKIDSVCDQYASRNVQSSLEHGEVCIFVCGTGSPFFSTDTGASLRACEINANLILMGKNNVDGVYDQDPHKSKNAKRFDKLSYDDVINLNLKVMDQSALTMCKENNIDILVFNIDEENCFLRVLNNEIKSTLITKGE